jgi:hypothetical protein
VEEVTAKMAEIQDVGSGTDELEPVLLTGHKILHAEDGATCYTAEVACRQFNKIREEARMPDSWRTHRCLLHYKGKGSDPHCVDNYRGLGIDQALLKLLSLVMLERLNTFLTETNGLARAQGGFQRERGTPEQVLTLTETVRAALRQRTVFLAFLDIERAYDSVLHPMLWKRCIDKGIDGHFLAVLQAMYDQAEVRVDVDGSMLPPVPLEGGVLQGNPLSPPLFNIFIDGAICELEEAGRQRATTAAPAANGQQMGPRRGPYGLPLPRVAGRGATQPRQAGVSNDQDDYLSSIFFADDGTLASLTMAELQEMMDKIVQSLADVGLTVNTRKTKMMVVQGHQTKDEEHTQLLKNVDAAPLRVNGTAIQVVDEFDYRGGVLNYRWDWTAAMREALKQADMAYGRAVVGGFNRAGTLDTMLQHAYGKIFCHFTYVAALMGAGTGAAAPHLQMQKFVHKVLLTIGGYAFLQPEALAIEAGVWDMQTRIDKLQLRFWCKIASTDHDSLTYRAVCLSIEQWRRPAGQAFLPPAAPAPPYAIRNPETTWTSRASQVRLQPWGQHLAAAAARMGLDVGTVLQMDAAAVARLQVQEVANGPWVTVDTNDVVRVSALAAIPPTRMRLAGTGYEDNERAVPYGSFDAAAAVTVATALTRWSKPLKEMCYVALQRRGNTTRQVLVKKYLAMQIKNDKPLRRWALARACSVEQAYWWATDTKAARRYLRLLFDCGPYEGNIRRRPFTIKDPENKRILLPRLDPQQRVCYLCGAADGGASDDDSDGPAVQTLEHVLLECRHAELAALRARMVRDLRAINVPTLANPDYKNVTDAMTVFMLCSAVGPLEELPVLLPGPCDATRVGRSRNPEPGRARQTAAWVAAALQEFNAAVRNVRYKGDPDQLPGGRLVKLVLEWALQIFLIHRRAVRDNDEYRLRLRDPAELRAARAAPRRTEEQRADQSKKRAAQKRAAKAVPIGPAAKLATAKRRVAAKDARAAAKQAAKDKAAGGGLQIAFATTRRQPQRRRKPPEAAAAVTRPAAASAAPAPGGGGRSGARRRDNAIAVAAPVPVSRPHQPNQPNPNQSG